ncbi:MAG: oxygenase MpaB family protein [Verrucomicrobiales bacterium]|nr:oxygenase MpaB family protein [Verrucomicrobiales bacterium]
MPDFLPYRFLFPLDSEMWRINHQKCGLFYGPAAAILQIAHPRIAQGVADHSNFESDSLGRLNRTLAATNRIAFGTKEEAGVVREKLRKMHQGVRGKTSPGMDGATGYSAFEPDLLLWVLATMIKAAIQGYELVERSSLQRSRCEQFYREMRSFGTWFGLEENYGPSDFEEFEKYYQSMIEGDLLGSHPLCGQLAAAIAAPRDTLGARILGKSIRFLPVETIPEPVRERLGFRSTPLTRGSMAVLLKTAAVTFKRWPTRMRLYPESIERLRRERVHEDDSARNALSRDAANQ